MGVPVAQGCPVHGRPLGACGRSGSATGHPLYSLLIGAIADLSADREPPIPLDAGFDSVAIRVSPIRSREWRDETGTTGAYEGPGPSWTSSASSTSSRTTPAGAPLRRPRSAGERPRRGAGRALSAHAALPARQGRSAAANDQTEFVIGEFKDPSRRSLVIIEEYC